MSIQTYVDDLTVEDSKCTHRAASNPGSRALLQTPLTPAIQNEKKIQDFSGLVVTLRIYSCTQKNHEQTRGDTSNENETINKLPVFYFRIIKCRRRRHSNFDRQMVSKKCIHSLLKSSYCEVKTRLKLKHPLTIRYT